MRERNGGIAVAVCILKAFVDSVWYLAFMTPFLLRAPRAAAIFLISVPCVWAVWIFLNRSRRNFADSSQDTFFFQVKVLLVAVASELLFLGVDRWQKECGFYVLLFFILGILLLRISRLSGEGKARAGFWGVSGVQLVLAVSAAAGLASAVVRNGLVNGLVTCYWTLILPVLEGVLWLLLKGLEALAPLFAGLFPNEVRFETNDPSVMVDGELGLEFEEITAVGFPVFLKAAGGLMACLAAGWLLLLLYRRLTGSWRTAPGEQTGVLQKSQAEEARQRNGSLEGLFQERNVRYYYRKFLKLCRQKGMELEPSMTSEAIAGIALRYWNEDVLKEFQTVYQKARYGVGLEGDKEKKRARELYRRLKEEASGNR